MSGRPTARSDVRQRRTTGWPTGGDTYGHGAPIVVVGVTPHQGTRESLVQGEAASREGGREPSSPRQGGGRAGARGIQRGRYAQCRSPQPDGSRPQSRVACEHWKAGCLESGHVRFGGGADGKGLGNQYLAGGLLYLGRGRRKRSGQPPPRRRPTLLRSSDPILGADHAPRRYAWCRPPRTDRAATRPIGSCAERACSPGAGICCAMPWWGRCSLT